MAQPLYWPGKRYFYAIGNTSAVSLARDVAPDKDISLLLLGCGDPRNVLFTLFSEHDAATRKLDFTCVDFEPAVLGLFLVNLAGHRILKKKFPARNVLLLSMIIDKQDPASIFDIFFHLYLETGPLSLLTSQCRALLDASTTLKCWKKSSYGSTLRMSSQHTLTELRRHWAQYARMHALPNAQLDLIVANFKAGVKEYQSGHEAGIMMHTSRSAGPLMMYAMQTLSDCFHDFWKYGTTFISADRRSAATLLNPTFVYTQAGIGCHVHYGTDPVIPFHLAPIFGNNNVAPSRSDIMNGIRAQFRDWCAAFRRYYERRQCTVRIFFADAILGTRALLAYKESGAVQTRIPVCQWRTETITLDEEEYKHAPLVFDVVDTSNLDDHIGLLNILVASIPFLPNSGDGVLYLESLLIQTYGDAPKDFTKRFHADLTVMSVLFRLCPVDFVTGYSTRGNIHEVLAYRAIYRMAADKHQYHQVTTWKMARSDPPVVDSRQLGTFLYDLYRMLFEEEDSQTFWQRHTVDFFSAVSRSSLLIYSRESFVILLKFIRDRLQIPREQWIAVLDRFFDIHGSNYGSMKMDTINYQDLCGLLHFHGVYTMDVYREPYRLGDSDAARVGPFSAWPKVPPLVRVFLTVPREKLRVLIEGPTGTPILQAGMRGSKMMNVFSSIHAAFGIVSASGTPANPKAYFEEDPEGFRGTKPLVVSFVMPSVLLTGYGPDYDPPRQISIILVFKSNTANTALYAKHFGHGLEIHSAHLFDKESVLVLPEQPLPSALSTSPRAPSAPGQIGTQSSISANFNEECDLLESFSAKIDVEDEQAKAAFQSSGAVAVQQISSGIIQLVLGGRAQEVSFPFPVAAGQHRLRLARKSLWIELIVPPRPPLTQGGGNVDPFPIAVHDLVPWSVHRLNLERLPVLNTKARKLDKWLNLHVSTALSEREMNARKNEEVDALMFVKDSIHSIFVQASGILPKGSSSQHVFALRDKAVPKNYDTVLFVDRLRFDLSAHTVVCDGFVLPLSSERVSKIRSDFQKLVPMMSNILLEPGELTSWKQLLPVLVERCRTWVHRDSCQYATEGRVPLTTKLGGIPLCSCGEGQDVQRMNDVPLWKPMAKYCTRIALSPLFGVSYLENIGRKDKSCCVCRAKAQFRCHKCKKDRYCGKACQKKDEARHKLRNHGLL
ncbi:hypothetical protein DFH08DRAFT_452928 [Mycena albidolilacea]|uniref:DUF4470 domain-containing protein n=1 Tax=Mycena albidolilacea TaxID=1033008 RepID=A0AAD6Z8K1_9AGAR|nr:hypothetical protein DFH08DRAFT_452928 [Mycena albidolilacea]